MKRAQIIGLEFMMAVLIALLVMSVLAFYFLNTNKNLMQSYTSNEQVLHTMEITESLVKGTGFPEDWNQSTVRIPGLASAPLELSSAKIQRFVNLTYNRTKSLFGISASEFFFQIRGRNGDNLAESGLSPKENTQCYGNYEAVSSSRVAMWEGQQVTLTFILWNDRCQRDLGAGQLYSFSQAVFQDVPETAFEEDNDPSYSIEAQQQNDGRYVRSVDEGIVVPDYTQLSFPSLGIQPSKTILNASLTFFHRENLAGGAFPTGEDFRRKVYCWDGTWREVGNYSASPDTSAFIETRLDLSSCIASVALANDINIRINFDPAFNINGFMDIDYAEVTVNTD